ARGFGCSKSTRGAILTLAGGRKTATARPSRVNCLSIPAWAQLPARRARTDNADTRKSPPGQISPGGSLGSVSRFVSVGCSWSRVVVEKHAHRRVSPFQSEVVTLEFDPGVNMSIDRD